MPVRKLLRFLPLWDVPLKCASPRHRPLSSLTPDRVCASPERSAFNVQTRKGPGSFVGISESSWGKRKELWPGHCICSPSLCTPRFPGWFHRSVTGCLNLCDLMDSSPPGSSVHGIFQARTLEWVAISSSRSFSLPRDGTCISCLLRCRQILYPFGELGRHFQAKEDT